MGIGLLCPKCHNSSHKHKTIAKTSIESPTSSNRLRATSMGWTTSTMTTMGKEILR
jgi:hypothetical protein